jgi:hypothetical protein
VQTTPSALVATIENAGFDAQMSTTS